eukprot:TRINITY_DN18917_c0_g1_i1.p1 TRINITY_DN18917_c0_g1~~TRINITY_DN18917_c0_g1_i1.p1  ORF type:complete len:176 (+),score=27.43 TRINITY_DN18917_c0_g1_i1:72-530(+)
MHKGHTYALGLWDTAGQEEYKRLRTLSYKETNIFLLCFSIADPVSFENIREKWVPEINHYAPHVPLVLVGTKKELRDDETTIKVLSAKGLTPVPPTKGENLAGLINAQRYVEVSAKVDPPGLKNLFITAIDVYENFQTESTPVKPKRRCILF